MSRMAMIISNAVASHYELRKWTGAYNALPPADQETPLAADDLELLAMAAYLVGRDNEYLGRSSVPMTLILNAGQRARAVRCAFWLGFRLLCATRWATRPAGCPAGGWETDSREGAERVTCADGSGAA